MLFICSTPSEATSCLNTVTPITKTVNCCKDGSCSTQDKRMAFEQVQKHNTAINLGSPSKKVKDNKTKNTIQKKDLELSIPLDQLVPFQLYDPEEELINKIYSKLWDNSGHLPDPVADAFRKTVIKTAIEICHETGDEDSYVKLCSETIEDWMKSDKRRNSRKNKRINHGKKQEKR